MLKCEKRANEIGNQRKQRWQKAGVIRKVSEEWRASEPDSQEQKEEYFKWRNKSKNQKEEAWFFFSANVIYWAESVAYVKSWASKTKQTNSKHQARQGNTWVGRILFILNSSMALRNFCPGFHRATSACLYFALFLFLSSVLPCCIRCGKLEKNTKK